MIERGRHSVLGIGIDAVDYEAAVGRITAAAREGKPLAVSALAVHGVMTGALDPEHAFRLNRLDLVVPDGQPVRWALNVLHGTHLTDRVYGPHLTLEVCRAAAAEGLGIYLYGSRPEVLARLQARLADQFPGLRVVGATPSRFRRLTADEKRGTAAAIRASGASIVLVGLGCPRQEVWVYEYRDLIGLPLLAVGAAFDFHAGLLPQAPPAMQRAGLEWLFRLGQEPKRLWRRYLLLNPAYVTLVALQALGLRRFDEKGGTPPEMSFG